MNNWSVRIGLGETSIDCLAIDPQGNELRIKVHGNGKLRGTFVAKTGTGIYEIIQEWPAVKDIFAGYELQILDLPQVHRKVITYDPQKSNIQLDEDIEQDIMKKEFEIYAGESDTVLIARLVTQTPLNEELPKMNIDLYFTDTTNALPELMKFKPVLLITKGLTDLVPASDIQEDNLYFFNILKDRSSFEKVIEIDEHIDEKGHITKTLSESEINEVLRGVYKARTKSVVIALINSSVNPIHEKIFKNLLTVAGYRFLFISHEPEQSIKLLLRLPVSMANNFITHVISRYLKNVQSKLGKGSTLKIMAHNGELFNTEHFYSGDRI
jgi:hypothetical protein